MNSMTGKVCLVTGGTSGIGFETALGLATLGARTVITGRDEARTGAAAKRLRELSGNAQVMHAIVDLSDMSAVSLFAAAFAERHVGLDVLINNAGAQYPDFRENAQGVELTWAVNHLAYVQLSLALLPLLRPRRRARIVNVASSLHAQGKIDPDELQTTASQKVHYGMMKAYNRSKLANVLFSYALARRLDPSWVTVNCLHPGVVRTGLIRELKGLHRALALLFVPFMVSPEKGARTSIHLAASDEVAGETGLYFVNSRPARSSARSHDRALQEQVWLLSLQQLGIDPCTTQLT